LPQLSFVAAVADDDEGVVAAAGVDEAAAGFAKELAAALRTNSTPHSSSAKNLYRSDSERRRWRILERHARRQRSKIRGMAAKRESTVMDEESCAVRLPVVLVPVRDESGIGELLQLRA
jgi:hypothetical protein